MKRILGVSSLLLLLVFVLSFFGLAACTAYEVLHEPQQPPIERAEPIQPPQPEKK